MTPDNVIHLGVISLAGDVGAHVGSIDDICRNKWEIPFTVRFYSLLSESNLDESLGSWAGLYFGCKFITDSPPKAKSTSSSNLFSFSILSSGFISSPGASTASIAAAPISTSPPPTSGSSSTSTSSTSSPRLNNSDSSLPKLSRSASSVTKASSPRTSSPRTTIANIAAGLSPRQNLSPRKFTGTTIDNINHMADICTHIIIIGNHDHLNFIIKSFPKAKVLVI